MSLRLTQPLQLLWVSMFDQPKGLSEMTMAIPPNAWVVVVSSS